MNTHKITLIDNNNVAEGTAMGPNYKPLKIKEMLPSLIFTLLFQIFVLVH